MPREHLLDVQNEIIDGIGIIRLDGELIAESRFEPERILRHWLEEGTCRAIILFGRVTHIDSGGLSTLLAALHRFRRHDGDLILAELNPSLDAVFEVTSMEHYFKIFPTFQDARDHFARIEDQARKSGAKSRARR